MRACDVVRRTFHESLQLASVCASSRATNFVRTGILAAASAIAFFGDLARHAFELEHHAARLHHRHPHLRRALAFTHAGFGGLLRDRLVGEDADPHLAAALDVTRERHTSGFDLTSRDPPRLQRLQAIGAERDLAARDGRDPSCDP